MSDQAFGDSKEAFAYGNTAYAAAKRSELANKLNTAAAKTKLTEKLNLAAADKSDPAADKRTAGDWESNSADDMYGGFNPSRANLMSRS